MRHRLWSPKKRIPQMGMGISPLKYHKNHALSIPLQSQARIVPRAHTRTKVLSCKIFRRLVVDYVYHKHCKFRGCSVVLTLQLNLHVTSTIGDEKGNTSSTIAARECSHGRSYDQKQSTTGRQPGLSFICLLSYFPSIKVRASSRMYFSFGYFWSLTFPGEDQGE